MPRIYHFVALLFSVCVVEMSAQWLTPVVLVPVQNASNQSLTPSLQWTSQVGTVYNVQVSEFNDFNSLVVSMSFKATAQTSSLLLGGLEYKTTYYVRIRGTRGGQSGSWSMTRAFTTMSEPAAMPLVMRPTNGATSQPTRDLLQWQTFPQALSYDVEVSPTTQFSVLAFRAYGVTETQTTTSLLSPSFTYYWRVRANTEAHTTPWSTTSTFTTGETPLSPQLLLPETESVSQSRRVELQWQSSSSATSYHVQVATNSTFQDVIMDDENVVSNRVIADVAPDALLFWRVSAINEIGEGTWSAWRSIHGMSAAIDVNAPPQLLSISVTPNPVANVAVFRYTVPAPGQVCLVIRDLRGIEVLRSALPHLNIGTYNTPMDISELSMGLYMYEVSYNNITHEGKLVIAR